jgi:hypothetical protein
LPRHHRHPTPWAARHVCEHAPVLATPRPHRWCQRGVRSVRAGGPARLPAAATRRSKSGAAQQHARGDASLPMATDATDAARRASDSSWSSIGAPKSPASTPRSSPPITAIATPAGLRASTTAFLRC